MTRDLYEEEVYRSADEARVGSAFAFLESQGDHGFIAKEGSDFVLYRFAYRGRRE